MTQVRLCVHLIQLAQRLTADLVAVFAPVEVDPVQLVAAEDHEPRRGRQAGGQRPADPVVQPLHLLVGVNQQRNRPAQLGQTSGQPLHKAARQRPLGAAQVALHGKAVADRALDRFSDRAPLAAQDAAQSGGVLDVAHHIEERRDPAALLQHLVDDQVVMELAVELAESVCQLLAGRAGDQSRHEQAEDTVRRQVGLDAIHGRHRDAERLRMAQQLAAHHGLADAAGAVDLQQTVRCAAGQ